VLLEQGDPAAGRVALARTEVLPFASSAGRWWRAVDLELVLAEGRAAEVPAAADAIAELYRRVKNPGAVTWRSAKARALHRLGHVEEARALADEDVALARQFGAPSTVGPALRLRGLLRGSGDGLGDLGEAVDALEGSLARLELAKALAALGGALRRQRQPTDAREPLRRALELADACGARGLVEEIRVELRATGVRPRAAALGGIEALTASERRVAGLAAEGATNREIAQALFVTPKTVELHLGNAYRKLGIRSRHDLDGKRTKSSRSACATDVAAPWLTALHSCGGDTMVRRATSDGRMSS
jgi:DNA-binding CsgD family transcriptional regulator